MWLCQRPGEWRPENQVGVTGFPRVGDLGSAAEIPVASQETAAECQLVDLPGGERIGHRSAGRAHQAKGPVEGP